MPIAMAMSAISALIFLASSHAHTLDHQHAVASVLTAGNGLVILWLASAIDAASRIAPATREEGRPLRVGVYSGPVVAGVIGSRKFAFDVWGDTVKVASRPESQGVPNRVHISHATWLLVRDRFEAEPRGPIPLRGLGAIQTYAVSGRREPRAIVAASSIPTGATMARRGSAAAMRSAAV